MQQQVFRHNQPDVPLLRKKRNGPGPQVLIRRKVNPKRQKAPSLPGKRRPKRFASRLQITSNPQKLIMGSRYAPSRQKLTSLRQITMGGNMCATKMQTRTMEIRYATRMGIKNPGSR